MEPATPPLSLHLLMLFLDLPTALMFVCCLAGKPSTVCMSGHFSMHPVSVSAANITPCIHCGGGVALWLCAVWTLHQSFRLTITPFIDCGGGVALHCCTDLLRTACMKWIHQIWTLFNATQ